MPSNKVKNIQSDNADEYKGEPLDDELANGPMAKRSCTDPICCLIFIAFIGGMIGIAAYALTKGNPTLIGRGYDFDGNMCGVDTKVKDYPYLYWPLPGVLEKYRKNTVCVKTCPEVTGTGSVDCFFNTAYPSSCAETDVGVSPSTKQTTLVAGTAPLTDFYIYDTLPCKVYFHDQLLIPYSP
jgi:hypothetical protein